jgi:hypothetical protein
VRRKAGDTWLSRAAPAALICPNPAREAISDALAERRNSTAPVSRACFFGLDQSQVRLYTAMARHIVLVMAALAICAVTGALLRHRTDTQAPPPVTPDQPTPPDPGMVPLTVPQVKYLLAARPTGHPPGHADRWLDWKRRHLSLGDSPDAVAA